MKVVPVLPTDATGQLLHDLVELARWRHARGQAQAPLLDARVEDGSPESVQELSARLRAVTAADLLPAEELSDALRELAEVVLELDERQLTLLRDRYLASRPVTLEELGLRFGVTRERMRQVETAIKKRLADEFGPRTTIGTLLASMRVEIQPIASLHRLLTTMPGLERDVPGLGVPLWSVLDKLDDAFEVVDGWAAAPDVRTARSRTSAVLDEIVDDHGTVELVTATSALGLPDTEAEAWLDWCGYAMYGGWVLTRTRSMDDHAAAVLSVAGEPLAVEEIASRTGRDLNPRSLANRLAEDDRFVRTDRARWALTDWGLEEYSGLKAEIARAVAAAGGEMPLQQLMDDLTARFAVSPASVQTYASGGDYEVREGAVRRRENRSAPRKRPEDTKRLHRVGDAWHYRVVVNRDHLRGSGFPVPAGFATMAGCAPGETVSLPSRLGPQAIRWTGTQSACGTVRRFLDELGAEEGDTVLLRVADGSFDVMKARKAGDDPIDRALALVGADATTEPAARLAVAAGLIADAKPRRILSAFRRRGDEEVVELLERAWVPQPASAVTSPAAR